MHITNRVLPLVAAGLGALALGCASTQVAYEDPTALKPMTTGFGASDLQMTANAMVDSLLAFPDVVALNAKGRPVLMVDKVKNKTTQHIDTEAVTDTIRAKLMQSGKFQFTDRTTEQSLREELDYQNKIGVVSKETAIGYGQSVAPEYMLTANLAEIQEHQGNVTAVYYKFTMALRNLRTGLLVWTDEKPIRKTATTSTFGW